MKKTLTYLLAAVLLVSFGVVVGMSFNRPTDVSDTSVDTLSSETQNTDNTEALKVQNTSEAPQSQAQEIIDTSNAQDLSHDKLWQYFEWIYHDLEYTFGYNNLAKPEMIQEQYNALETRFKDFFDISEYKLPDNYKSEYDKYLKEKIPALDIAVETITEKPDSSGSEQKPAETKPTAPKQTEQKPAAQKPVEQKPAEPKQTEQKPVKTSNSSSKSYIEELREMYPGISDEDLLSLFGDPSKEVTLNRPEDQSGLFGG